MWFYQSLITLLLWGLWGFFAKIASNYISAQSVYLWGSAGALIVTLLSLIIGFRFETSTPGIIYGLLAGLTGGGGVIFFYYALKEGKASLVVTMTALYPLVTIMLSYLILKEDITLRQAIGMLFALIAMVLMAG
ncbi:MAG: EamA family transporter [Thermodesulfovibrionales bacterium]|nr:EamA family transporter [Thermodesulfovibrionales bacterium]